MPKRFILAFVAFVGLIVPATFALAPLAAPSVRPELATTQARIKSLCPSAGPEICTATRLYFLEVVKARAVTALCKSGAERDLGRLDADVEHINEAIAARRS